MRPGNFIMSRNAHVGSSLCFMERSVSNTNILPASGPFPGNPPALKRLQNGHVTCLWSLFPSSDLFWRIPSPSPFPPSEPHPKNVLPRNHLFLEPQNCSLRQRKGNGQGLECWRGCGGHLHMGQKANVSCVNSPALFCQLITPAFSNAKIGEHWLKISSQNWLPLAKRGGLRFTVKVLRICTHQMFPLEIARRNSSPPVLEDMSPEPRQQVIGTAMSAARLLALETLTGQVEDSGKRNRLRRGKSCQLFEEFPGNIRIALPPPSPLAVRVAHLQNEIVPKGFQKLEQNFAKKAAGNVSLKGC